MAEIFNNPKAVVEGWYWALRSSQLRRGQVRAVTLMGRDLALYRGEDGRVVAMDAYCPHMGAHLAEGRVEGSELRCFFHHWKYDRRGVCVDIPSLGGCPPMKVKTPTWPVEERYGLIFVWTGETARHPLPYVPELQHEETVHRFGNRYVKKCHPHVVMINAIDEHHFASVHSLPVDLYLEAKPMNEVCIQFDNITRVKPYSAFTRFLARFYKGALTYCMTYWYANTGMVTTGPDFVHFNIIFFMRMTPEGHAEGQSVLIAKKRKGLFGFVKTRVILFLTKIITDYFASGDTKLFETIRFNLNTPTRADHAIINFMRFTERLRLATAWTAPPAARTAPLAAPESRPSPAAPQAVA